jgi:hypothetical protein
LHTIINPTLQLLFLHHRIPIFVNPINNGLEAFDHLTVVPGLARLRQYTGIIPRLSIIGVPQDKSRKWHHGTQFLAKRSKQLFP